MPRRALDNLLLVALLGLLAAACQQAIGDSCVSDSECARTQTCDTTSPGGYCIEYGCAPNECPPEAVCVDFFDEGDLLLSACMRRCDKNSQCRQRDGYVCRRDIGPVPFCGVAPTEPNESIDDGSGSADGSGGEPGDGSADGALDGSASGALDGSGEAEGGER